MGKTLRGAAEHRSHEHIVLPIRETVARIKGHAGGRDRRSPEDDRTDHAFAEAHNLWPGVVAAKADQRPSVVIAGLQYVDLITAVGTVLVVPHLAGYRVQRETQRIAMTHGVDFSLVPGTPRKRVARGRRPVVLQPKDLSTEARAFLSGI